MVQTHVDAARLARKGGAGMSHNCSSVERIDRHMSIAGLMTTDRFMVREFTEHDREAFIACHMDPEFSRFHLESERGAAHASSVFDLFLLWQREEPRLNYQLAVAPRDDPKTYLGNVGVRMGGLAPGQADLGIELISSCWGNGAATEIMAAILPWATRRFGLTTFIAETAIENAAAEQLARKTGLRQFSMGEKRMWRSDRG
ncbi:anhydro-N-acetylmuramic acid kinase [Paracoccus haematequi]|uniref:Anhydro-N-acetylmuramic acid kinase n=2 Tax=Paracoccus haematequi TaxID=2491866 RepID=A0A3S5D474_9RHOB|nr:anhydro-N-acetylmuramic acid kinase [Paracoccus haematequi]